MLLERRIKERAPDGGQNHPEIEDGCGGLFVRGTMLSGFRATLSRGRSKAADFPAVNRTNEESCAMRSPVRRGEPSL